LLAWVPVLLIRGVLSHTRHHLRCRWIKAAFALIVSVLAYNNSIGTPHLMIDIAAPATIAMVLFTIGAGLLLRDLPADARAPSWFLAITSLSAVGVWILQILFLAGVFGGIGDPESADFIRALVPIALIVITVAATFALFSIEVSKMETALTRGVERCAYGFTEPPSNGGAF
jgi:hypothetical protein